MRLAEPGDCARPLPIATGESDRPIGVSARAAIGVFAAGARRGAADRGSEQYVPPVTTRSHTFFARVAETGFARYILEQRTSSVRSHDDLLDALVLPEGGQMAVPAFTRLSRIRLRSVHGESLHSNSLS